MSNVNNYTKKKIQLNIEQIYIQTKVNNNLINRNVDNQLF